MSPESPPAVLDTNVIVSAFLFPASLPGRAFRHLLRQRSLLRSSSTLVELHDVFLRPKFEGKLPLVSRLWAVTEYEQATHLIPVLETIRACRDPRDDKFLELAVSGKASLILSGDADLLALHPFRGIAIRTPADYLAGFPAG